MASLRQHMHEHYRASRNARQNHTPLLPLFVMLLAARQHFGCLLQVRTQLVLVIINDSAC